MSDQPKKRWSAIKIVMTTVAILVLYVLSFGPVFRIYRMTGLGRDHPIAQILVIIYMPVSFLMMISDVVRSWMEWYMSLWLP